jgi:DNA-binding transcriptional regulator YdaS (Cro superfamily)
MKPIERAIQAVGGQQTELARRMTAARGVKVHPQAVHRWVKQGLVPAKHCVAVEQATGGAVTRYELRPDFFGAPPAAFTSVSDKAEAA